MRLQKTPWRRIQLYTTRLEDDVMTTDDKMASIHLELHTDDPALIDDLLPKSSGGFAQIAIGEHVKVEYEGTKKSFIEGEPNIIYLLIQIGTETTAHVAGAIIAHWIMDKVAAKRVQKVLLD